MLNQNQSIMRIKLFLLLFILSIAFRVNANDEKRIAAPEAQKISGKQHQHLTKPSAYLDMSDEQTIAVILAIISIAAFPLALHNWYLGNTRKALLQSLLVFPLGLLIFPFIISWIWQVADLFHLLK